MPLKIFSASFLNFTYENIYNKNHFARPKISWRSLTLVNLRFVTKKTSLNFGGVPFLSYALLRMGKLLNFSFLFSNLSLLAQNTDEVDIFVASLFH